MVIGSIYVLLCIVSGVLLFVLLLVFGYYGVGVMFGVILVVFGIVVVMLCVFGLLIMWCS